MVIITLHDFCFKLDVCRIRSDVYELTKLM